MSTVLGSFATPAAAQAVRASPPRVVATVAPVHSLVAQIMEGIGRPLLLLPSGASPHGTALRLSQMRALRRADIVFWIGAGFETFLAAPLEAMAGDSRIVTLIEQPGMAPGPARRRAGSDPHIWLDPENGIRILRAAEAALTAADPANASRYGANLSRAAARLASLDRELADVLKRVEGIPYVVFHDAYGYFERRYRLSPVAHITVAPHRPPGAARLRRIRRTIASGRAGCVFTEPQFPPKLAAMLVAGTEARRGVLDPLGAGLPPGTAHYAALMRNLARALVRCLAPK
jgi:zinc transport system substrate-binding protein